MPEQRTRADWRPPTDQDWRRLRTLLRDVGTYLALDADRWAPAEQDLRDQLDEDAAREALAYLQDRRLRGAPSGWRDLPQEA